jgi:rhodanese-related sulfurtransferase
VARALHQRGFTLVRPLEGGLDAWVRAGYPVEEQVYAIRPAAGR